MKVIVRNPVPFYELTCTECHSVIQYKASEVCTCHITCPVCGVSNWADKTSVKEEIIDPCDLVEDLAERIGINQLYAIVKNMRGE